MTEQTPDQHAADPDGFQPEPPAKSEEVVTGQRVIQGTVMPGHDIQVALSPTQVRRPWRSTARTLFQALVALCVLFPLLVENTGLKLEDAPWLAIPLAVAAAIARLMALPQVETFLRTFIPFLSAAPNPSKEH